MGAPQVQPHFPVIPAKAGDPVNANIAGKNSRHRLLAPRPRPGDADAAGHPATRAEIYPVRARYSVPAFAGDDKFVFLARLRQRRTILVMQRSQHGRGDCVWHYSPSPLVGEGFRRWRRRERSDRDAYAGRVRGTPLGISQSRARSRPRRRARHLKSRALAGAARIGTVMLGCPAGYPSPRFSRLAFGSPRETALFPQGARGRIMPKAIVLPTSGEGANPANQPWDCPSRRGKLHDRRVRGDCRADGAAVVEPRRRGAGRRGVFPGGGDHRAVRRRARLAAARADRAGDPVDGGAARDAARPRPAVSGRPRRRLARSSSCSPPCRSS